MTEFTPIASTIGGIMIGLSAVFLMAWQGRIAGISGLAGRLLPPYSDNEFAQRLAFVLGIVAAPFVVMSLTGEKIEQTVPTDLAFMAIAGLIVGFGSTWGNGCTSGHGVCGLSRLSIRSVVATATFMVVAIATTFVIRHVIGA